MAIVLDGASAKLAVIKYFTMGMTFYTKRDSTANDILVNDPNYNITFSYNCLELLLSCML